MGKLVSINSADNYTKVGEVTISTEADIKAKVAKAQADETAWKELGVEAPIRFRQRTNEIAESTSEVTCYTDEELTWFLDNGLKALADEVTLQSDQSLHRQTYKRHVRLKVYKPKAITCRHNCWGAKK